ncbi:Uncharacterised protein [Mycobacteroides abscessus subsp. massiliense]|uniref:DUF6197 family protein n=1 Tax=Mycobacteroides abscessus TaxID=36809 RepID=UPI0009A75471|nr:hypothetical protein [Mycobacteroides abscessus]SKU74597.1 Uncharacterised protein [Mycobacteroides abscessus subsp. massiliense]SKV06137.1 Uncharacterised protein [Mycobacteroides abscessus subsp. massiliense]
MTTAAVIDNALIGRILRGALAELRRPINPITGNGWTREAYGQPDSCKCAAGAIRLAISAEFGVPTTADTLWFSKWNDVCEAACARLCAGAGIGRGPEIRQFEACVLGWNDVEVETFAEVEAAFEKAIAITEAAA